MILATICQHNASVPIGFLKSLLACREWEHMFSYGLYLDDNRNSVWDIMKERNDDLLFIDSDMSFTPEDVKKIQKHLDNKDIVSGKYTLSIPWDYPDKLSEVDVCGAGFLGISQRVIHSLDRPFTRFINQNSGKMCGEDMAFCIKAKDAGFKIWCDPEIKLGHIKTQII